ncbi:MAG: hypothetical protein HY861_00715 [Chlamydiia bacterium]|nr:hypothetical protein [Chlamydiia bacterium]
MTTIVFQINERMSCERVDNKVVSLQASHGLKEEMGGGSAIAKYHTPAQAVIRFLGTMEGGYRFSQLFGRVPKWLNAVRVECGMGESSFLRRLGEKGDAHWSSFVRIPSTTQDAISSVRDARDAVTKVGTSDALRPEQVGYQVKKALRDVADWVSTVGYSAATVCQLIPTAEQQAKKIIQVSDTVTLGGDVVSAQMSMANLGRMQAMAKVADAQGASAELVDTIQQTKRYNMLALAKDICAITSGIFGLIFLATGISVVSGIVLLTIGLASTLFAVTKKLYEETMSWKPINFFDSKHVTCLQYRTV